MTTIPESAAPITFPFDVGTHLPPPATVAATPAQHAAYLTYTQIGDPAADALVTMFARLPTGQGRRMFEHAVEHGVAAVDDAPPELVDFFAQVDPVPYWVDPAQLELACRVLARTGPLGYTALSMMGLMGGYLAARVCKPLVRTGDLQRMATRRIAETTAWAADVTSPGGLDRYGDGFKNTLRVRLMHALVRAGMSRRPDWDFAAWDVPLNQSQMVGTIMTFAISAITGSQALGLHFTQREKEAVYHLWRYVGQLIGVDPAIQPTCERDYWRLLWLQSSYEFGAPDQDSRDLARALAAAIGPAIVGQSSDPLTQAAAWMITGFHCAYARKILGPAGDHLDLPDSTVFRALVDVTSLGIAALEYPRRWIPGATRWRERWGERTRTALTQRMMALHNGDRTYARADTVLERNTRAAVRAVRTRLRSA